MKRAAQILAATLSGVGTLCLAGPASAGLGAWTTGGPNGASVRALAIHPSAPATVYAGAVGGIFKSVDGGGHWAPVNAGLPDRTLLQVNALAIDPTTPSIVYAGVNSGTGGRELFKSVDSGASWIAADSGLSGEAVFTLAIDPSVPATLYAGTFAGVFKSVDSGGTWAPANAGLPNPAFLKVDALAIDPSNPSTLYAGTESGISRSVNSGATWVSLSAPAVKTLAIDPKTPSTLFAGTPTGLVLKSLDSGNTWAAASAGLPQEAVSALAIDPVTPSTLYAGTLGKVFKSIDSGANWIGVAIGLPSLGLADLSVRALAIDPMTPATLYAGDGGGVMKSVTSGASWAPASTGLVNLSISALAVDPKASSTLYAGTENGLLFKSVDSGSHWAPASTGLPNTRVLAVAIDPETPSTLYAGEDLNGLYKSTNSGGAWTRTSLRNPGSPIVTSVWALAIDPTSPSTLYAALDARPSTLGAVLRSTDSGGTWALASTGLASQTVSTLAIDPIVSSTLYAGTLDGAGIFKSTDGGTSWSSSGWQGFSVPALAIDPNTPSTLYASLIHEGTGAAAGVYRSTDSGVTWTRASTGLTDLRVRALAVDSGTPSTLYAGTAASGVFRSTDSGTSWTAVNRGLKGLSVRVLALDRSGPTTVYAGLSPGSVWQATPPALGESDLALTVSGSADPVTGTTPLAYTLRVTNEGPDAASSVSVTQTLPAGVVVDSANGEGWTCDASGVLVTCTRPVGEAAPLPPIFVQVTPGPAAGNLTSSASVSAAEVDSDSTNNSATVTTAVREAQVWLATRTKTASADAGRFLRNTDLTYTITLTNGGRQAQEDNPGPELEDVLPTGLALVSVSASSGIAVADPVANRVSWNGSLPSGGSVVLTVHARIKGTVSLGTAMANQGKIRYDVDGNHTNGGAASTDDPTAPGPNDPTTFVVVSGPLKLYTLPPCRVVDTRDAPGPFGGPALSAGVQRSFPLRGRCGIPSTAQAVSVNLTVSGPSEEGHLRLYPADASLPLISSINYAGGQTRANDAVMFLSDQGEVAAYCAQFSGTVHFILDVNGYFE